MKASDSLGGIFGSLDVSSSGMYVQRTRLNTIASNIANINTTRTPGGGYYHRKVALIETKKPERSFDNMLAGSLEASALKNLQGVRIAEIHEVMGDPKMVYEPDHPDADEDGFVSYPAINIIEEMVEMIMASRSFEANLTVFNAAKQMISQTLEI